MADGGIQLTPQLLEGFVSAYLYSRLDNPCPTPQFHREMWEMCVSNQKHVVIAAPRGFAKSTAITLAYALTACLFRQRDFVVIVSDTWGQSVEFLRDLKAELNDNDELKAAFGILKFLKDSEDDVIVKLRDGHKFRIVARGSEQKVRGLKWNNKRPNLIIGDDLEGDEQVESKNRRDKFFNWLMKALLPCGSDDCIFRFVGTVLHFDSALERLLNDPNWHSRRYRAHKEFNDFSELLWPEKRPESWLRKEREKYIGQNLQDGYSAEYLNDPIAHGESKFRKEDMIPLTADFKAANKVYYAGWDFAVTTETKSDFTVGSVWGVDAQNRKGKVDTRRGRMDTLGIVEEMFAVEKAWKPVVHFVESGTINNSIMPTLSVEMLKRQTYLNLVKITSSKDKLTRSGPLQAIVKQHGLMFDRDSSCWEDTVEEYTRFPKGGHDDIVDSDTILARGIQDIQPSQSDEELEEEEYHNEFGFQEEGRNSVTGY